MSGVPMPWQPDPSRLIGAEWIEHGYRVTPDFREPEECPICQSPDTTCTDATHRAGMAYLKAQEQEDGP